MHLGLAAQLIDVAQELALVGANGLAQALVVAEDGTKPEGQHGGVLEAVGDHPRMPPGEDGVDTPHLSVEAIVGLVADRHDRRHAAGCLADQFRQLLDPLVAGDVLRVAYANAGPRLDNRFVDVSARDAQRPEEIAFAALVHAQARQEQVGIQHRLIAEPRFLQDLGLQRKLDELLRPLALHHQLAALVKHHVGLLLLRGEPRVRDLAEAVVMPLQPGAQRGRLGIGELAGIGR